MPNDHGYDLEPVNEGDSMQLDRSVSARIEQMQIDAISERDVHSSAQPRGRRVPSFYYRRLDGGPLHGITSDTDLVLAPAWPPAKFYALMLLIGPLYYFVLIVVPTTWLSYGFTWHYVWPALVLTIGWTIRGVVKFRERQAASVRWPHPVGRQQTPTLLRLVAVCCTFGAIGGWLLAMIMNAQGARVPIAAPIIIGIAVEMIGVVRGIPEYSERK